MTKEEILNNFREETGAKYDINYWNAALKAMEAYASQQKGCSRWVKASERLPEMEKVIFLKLDGNTMGMGNFYEDNQSYMLYIQRNGAHEEFDRPYHARINVEWLDESSPCSCDQLIEQLKKIKELTSGEKYHEKDYVEIIAEIDLIVSAIIQTKAQ